MKHPLKLVDFQMERLEKGFRKLGLNYDEEIIFKFRLYIELLLSYNRRAALFSKGDEPIVAEKHILPSVALARLVSGEAIKNWLDVGSGAGFPALPMKLFLKHLPLIMVESNRKKALFLSRAIRELGLDSCEAKWMRAEDIPEDTKFDLITIRAVEKPQNIFLTAQRILENGGRFIWIRGRHEKEELELKSEGIEKLGLKIIDVVKLPGFYPCPRLYAILFSRFR